MIMDIETSSTSFENQIPQNREFNELEQYCEPCRYKDGIPLYDYRVEFVDFMRNEILDCVLCQRNFIVESPSSATDSVPNHHRLTPPEWIEVFRPFIKRGYHVYHEGNKLILTARTVVNPLPLVENKYILEYYEKGKKSYRQYPFEQHPPLKEKSKFQILESLRKILKCF